jgi:drug/metabolite transporter (DMT)-like permease
METWVLFTLLAALMQAVRTAGQKKLATDISPMAATLVRYLFGLPFAALYLVVVTGGDSGSQLSAEIGGNPRFLVYASLASVAQILATACLVRVLTARNFAVGSSFAKTEAVQTAVLGWVFFAAALSWAGWLAVLLGVAGIVSISVPLQGVRLDRINVIYGLMSGFFFAITSLWLREASLSLPLGFIENAATTLLFMVCQQTLLCFAYVASREPGQLQKLKRHIPVCIFVGATSALGSIGWFTAMTYQNPALVKSLGQVEFLFTLLLTHFFFREKISPKEYLGMAAIAASVLILLLLH